MTMTRYHLKELPAWQPRPEGDADKIGSPPDGVNWWSGTKTHPEPPKIGAHVDINFNSLGCGIVSGYFIEHGWLGVYVKLCNNPPDWWVKQNFGPEATERQREHAREGAMVFGAELEKKEQK